MNVSLSAVAGMVSRTATSRPANYPLTEGPRNNAKDELYRAILSSGVLHLHERYSTALAALECFESKMGFVSSSSGARLVQVEVVFFTENNHINPDLAAFASSHGLSLVFSTPPKGQKFYTVSFSSPVSKSDLEHLVSQFEKLSIFMREVEPQPSGSH